MQENLQPWLQENMQHSLQENLQPRLQENMQGAVVKGNELVWRTVADAALRGERRWSSVGQLADESGVPLRTGYLAIERLLEIGAMEPRNPGVATTNPEKVLTLLAAWRNLRKDTIARTTLETAQSLMDSSQRPYAIGGADAALVYLDGWNNVADVGMRYVYMPAITITEPLPSGDEVSILSMDKRAIRNWTNGYSSLAQTYADLFAQAGWQAEEFRRMLWSRHFATPDWDQKEMHS